MKNTILKLVASAALLVSSASFASIATDEIKGNISFGGTSITTASAGVVTTIDYTSAVTTAAATEDFASIVDGTVAGFIDPWTVGPIASLWTVGGFSFEVTSILYNTAGSISNGFTDIILAEGLITHDDYLTTSALFSWNASSITDEVTFSATAIPEPTTIALLGLGLIGFGAARRNKKA